MLPSPATLVLAALAMAASLNTDDSRYRLSNYSWVQLVSRLWDMGTKSRGGVIDAVEG